MNNRIPWGGTLIAVQPRIRLTRSFDQRDHTYLGFNLTLQGQIGDERREFQVAIGKAAQTKHEFQIGMEVAGQGHWVADERMETAELYKVSQLKVTALAPDAPSPTPPWPGIPPELPAYRERGHRRLAARTYSTKCSTCIWGCEMPIVMIVDHWNPSQKRYRFEAFCYGPKSCPLYRAGRHRIVPGRKGMSWEEPNWVDEQETAHRGPDD